MVKDLWLPKGHTLADGSRIRSLLFSGDEWQILDTNGSENILIARPELAQKWSVAGFLDESLLGDISFGTLAFRSLNSHKRFALSPVESGQFLESKVDAIAFSLALRESRKVNGDVSFHDAVYVEQFSRLLPAWTLTPHVEDEVVLGTLITGGVVISTKSFRRLTNLTGWMPPGDLIEIIKAAGLHVPTDAGLLAKHKEKSHSQVDEKGAMEDSDMHQKHDKLQASEADTSLFVLPGRPQLENFFNEHVIDIIFNAEKYQTLGIDFPSAIVLHGPPGCGKTFAVEKLVEFIDWPSYSIDSSSVGSPFIHDTSKKISEVFDIAIGAAPSVLVIDEMESFLSDRRSGGTSSLHHIEEVAEFLRRIPEAVKSKVLIIAMTNMIDLIDPAILRRGRFDHVIEVGMPSREEVSSLLEFLIDKLPKAEDIDLERTLDVLTGRALSDSAYVVREAARLAAKVGKSQIDQESISQALATLPADTNKKSKLMGFAPNQ